MAKLPPCINVAWSFQVKFRSYTITQQSPFRSFTIKALVPRVQQSGHFYNLPQPHHETALLPRPPRDKPSGRDREGGYNRTQEIPGDKKSESGRTVTKEHRKSQTCSVKIRLHVPAFGLNYQGRLCLHPVDLP